MSAVFKTNFAVIGRTVLDATAIIHKNNTAEEWNALKISLRDRMLAQGKKPTPLMIENEISKIKKSITILELIETVKENGCGIKYYSADLQDIDQVSKVVSSIRSERSQITALVHGAGVEISHRLEQKSPEEFFRVIGSKVFSALAMDEALKNEPLKRIFAFSSISGRFGNDAQLDYSSANDFLNFWVRSLNQQGRSAISINWSGWDEIGMAVRNSFIKEHSEKMGIHLIDPKDGVAAAVSAFVDSKRQGEMILHKGLGPINESAFFKTDLSKYPFVDRLDVSNESLNRSSRVFSPSRDLFLHQHRVNDIALLPGVVYLEIMAEHLHLTENVSLPMTFKDMKFHEASKFHNDLSKELSLTSRSINDNDSFEMRLTSTFKGKNINLQRELEHCSAVVERAAVDSDFIAPERWAVEHSTPVTHTDLFGSMNKNYIYIGPLIDDMTRANRKDEETTYIVNEDSFVQYSWMPFDQINNPEYPLDQFVFNPCFMDTVHQAGAIYSQVREKEFYLPVGADEFCVLEKTTSFSRHKTTVKFKKKTGDLIYYDILCQDETGKPCIYIKNSCYRKTNI